jgi:quercetin dioxygenase-like cupin family protein
MKHARLSDSPAVDAGTTNFHGVVRRHDLIGVDDPPSGAALVRFEAGARSHWHRHAGGQYLYGVEGEGRVQSRGGEVVSILVGHVVHAAPGEEHWHGAGVDQPFAQLAISLGEVEWLGPVEDG